MKTVVERRTTRQVDGRADSTVLVVSLPVGLSTVDGGPVMLASHSLDFHHVQLAAPWPGRSGLEIIAHCPKGGSHAHGARVLNASVHSSVGSGGIRTGQPCRSALKRLVLVIGHPGHVVIVRSS